MSEHIPAWKRIGLKVKQELEVDPLDVTTHLDSGKITAKQTKQLNKKKRAAATTTDGEKKPPKRQKLPKSERPPPPEKDQLVYVKTYTTDRENWKFSKQKQNWILKHIKIIEDKYEEYLVKYLQGLQGGSKDRLVESMKKVVESWNKAALEDDTKKEEESTESEDKKEVKKDTKDDLESVDSDYAIRARKIVGAITGEELKLTGIDDQEKKIDSEESKSDSSDESKSSQSSNESSESSSESQSSSSSDTGSSSSESSEEEKTPEPKVPDTSNLIVEQVEVTDFLNDEDYMDPLPEAQKSSASVPEAAGSESDSKKEESGSDEGKSKKEKRSKKEKKEKKERKSKK